MENKVKKVIYILLAIFFGGFGVHQFYAKKFKTGILYLIFCWTMVPALLSYYDAFLALTQSSDGNGMIAIPEYKNKKIPIIIASALVILTVFFVPKEENKLNSTQSKIEKKEVKKSPVAKKKVSQAKAKEKSDKTIKENEIKDDGKEYTDQSNIEYADHLTQELNKYLSEQGVNEHVYARTNGKLIIELILPQGYKYQQNVVIQELVDGLYNIHKKIFADWCADQGYDTYFSFPRFEVKVEDGTTLAKEKIMRDGMKLKINNK